jgi:UDP-perosamine 4-acetyltransferase
MMNANPENKIKCVILGGGGHTKGLIDALRASASPWEVVGILDPDAAKQEGSILGLPVLGDDGLLAELCRQGVTHFIVGLGGAGDTRPRARLYDLGVGLGMRALSVLHPTAYISPFAELGEGVQVFPRAVVMPGARLGDNVIVNTSAIVEHDCAVGRHAHVSSGAHLAGSVTVGAGAHIGIGSVVRQGISIGDYALVGAGAVVVKDIPAGQTVVGNPSNPIRK